MINSTNSIIFLFFLFYTLLSNSNCKGGRGGGGGGGRGGSFGGSFGSARIGSNNNNVRSMGNVGAGNNARTGYGGGAGIGVGNNYGNNYRGGAGGGFGGSVYTGARTGGMRWASFGAGLLAYNAMSSLARTGHYHNGYYQRNNYHSTNSKYNGETCTNNEDFNGTVFGTFRCPLPIPEPDFDPSAKYCCGTNQTQYCCSYFDDNSRRVTVLSAVLCVAAIIICSALCISRMIKRRGNFFKPEQTQYSTVPPPNRLNIPNDGPNRNMNGCGPQPYFNQMQPRPNMNMKPSPNQRLDNAGAPFIPNQQIYNPNIQHQNAPYPMQPAMPQPNLMPQPNTIMMPQSKDYDGNVPPPSYTEVVKTTYPLDEPVNKDQQIK